MANEKLVKKKVKKLLDAHDWFWWMPPANMYGQVGISDFHALRDGVFMAIETKSGRNKLSANQKGFLSSVLAETGIAFVVNEDTLEWFSQWLDAFARSVDATRRGEDVAAEDGALMLNAIKVLTSDIV